VDRGPCDFEGLSIDSNDLCDANLNYDEAVEDQLNLARQLLTKF
jgi:hypothetical protein